MAEQVSKFKLVIITPEKKFYEEDVNRVIFRTTEGDIGVLPGHIPLTVGLSSGPCVITIDNKEHTGIIHGGFAEVTGERVTILVDAAEWPDEIDVERAKRRMQEAERILEDPHADEIKQVAAKSIIMRQTERLKAREMNQH